MIQINDALLGEIGLNSLPQEERRALLNHIYETLELRVGMRLADQMTNEQLDEFEKYFEAKDDKGAFNWLETNFPNYKDIVQQEFDKLKSEVSQSAPQILSASQSSSNTPVSGGTATQPSQPYYQPTNPNPGVAQGNDSAGTPPPTPPTSPSPQPPTIPN